MSKRFTILLAALLIPSGLLADVSTTDRGETARLIQNRAANRNKTEKGKALPEPRANGSIRLVDADGLNYFIDTNITFNTTKSDSGAASEANYTHAVAATTAMGGTTNSTLNDEFDGYGGICLSINGSDGPCDKSNASFQFYNKTGGVPAPDNSCVAASTTRQYLFPPLTLFTNIRVQREVFVPNNDTFIRWMNIFTNTGATPITFRMITGNDLGSDSITKIVASSSGDAAAQPGDTWITSFQDYSGNTSSDVRTGAVLQGAGSQIPVHFIQFNNGDDRPFWSYLITLAPGQTRIIMTYATGQASIAAANAKASELAALPPNATQCMSSTQLAEVGNFAVAAVTAVPALNRNVAVLAALLLALAAMVALRLRG